jgi:prevent-host-death family protein
MRKEEQAPSRVALSATQDGAICGTIFGIMKIAGDIRPVTEMKTHAARLLRTVGKTRRPMVITRNGQPEGVLMDYESFQEMREATLLLKLVAQGEVDIRAGRVIPQAEVFRRVRGRLRRE